MSTKAQNVTSIPLVPLDTYKLKYETFGVGFRAKVLIKSSNKEAYLKELNELKRAIDKEIKKESEK